ncbi:MAG: ATP-binding domain-containing protein [Halofilum sp. (in: g-proteobacteria)]|nr:ATP-binding domain-containing protein [Halofilum sp. (in: g-proteobacteria)]
MVRQELRTFQALRSERARHHLQNTRKQATHACTSHWPGTPTTRRCSPRAAARSCRASRSARAHLAKGLEFDQVLVPKVSDRNYRTPIDRNLLYVACTRAMHRLVLTHAGTVTPLLAREKVAADVPG